MKRIGVEQLQQADEFELLDELDHAGVQEFAITYYLYRRNWLVYLHYLISLILFIAWIWASVVDRLDIGSWLVSLSAAVVAFILLVPVHEGLHGLVYKALGAPQVQFHLSLRNFYAYAIADGFVVTRREFIWIALAPFIMINGLLSASMLVWPVYRVFLLGLLLLHTSATSGDWALLNYMWLHRRYAVYTYDEAGAKRSYFYARCSREAHTGAN